MDKSKAINLFRNRFKRYKKAGGNGETQPFEKNMEKYPEQGADGCSH